MLGFVEYAKNKAKKKVVLVVGSPRSPNCCPDEKSKTHKVAEEMRKKFSGPGWTSYSNVANPPER